MRSEASAPTILSTMLVDPIVFTMGKRMLLGLQARAEGQPDTAAALAALAWLGFITTGIVTASQFLRQGWRAFWLVLPVLAALPALWMAQDAQSGLVAFTAVSIPILGFLTFGRSWWGPLLIISAIALLALLLAPEAFTAFGQVLLAAVAKAAASHRHDFTSANEAQMSR